MSLDTGVAHRDAVIAMWLDIKRRDMHFQLEKVLTQEGLWDGDDVEGPLRSDVKKRLGNLVSSGGDVPWSSPLLPPLLTTITQCAIEARNSGQTWDDPLMSELSRVFPRTFVHDFLRHAVLQCLASQYVRPDLLRKVLDREFKDPTNGFLCWREIGNEFAELLSAEFSLDYKLN